MTINCTASVALAMYLALADKQGVSLGPARRHHAERHAQGVHRPEGVDLAAGVRRCASSWTRSSSARSTCRASTRCRSPATTSARRARPRCRSWPSPSPTASATCRPRVARGLDVDDFAPRLSFFFDIHNDFFEEIAKLRAARRIWATVMRDRFGAQQGRSRCGCAPTPRPRASRPPPSSRSTTWRGWRSRPWPRCWAGAQSLHTNSYDEVLALPTEEAVTVALRTQQIIAEETGVAAHRRSRSAAPTSSSG